MCTFKLATNVATAGRYLKCSHWSCGKSFIVFVFVVVLDEAVGQKNSLATGYLTSRAECVAVGMNVAVLDGRLSPCEELPSSPETFGIINGYAYCDEINQKNMPTPQLSGLTDSIFSPIVVASSLYNTGGLESSDNATVPECELSTEDMLLDLDEAITDVIMNPLKLAEIGLYLPPVSADDVESLLSSPPTASAAPPAVVPVSLETGPSPVAPSSVPVHDELISVASPSGSEMELSPVTVTCLPIYEEQDGVPSPASSQSSVSAPPSKKLRKKEQNKTAAQKYRQKKRGERGLVMTEYEQLERKNIELRTRVEEMTREVDYLKGLIEEICA